MNIAYALGCTTFHTAWLKRSFVTLVCWLADLVTRTSGRPCRHPEKSYANEFNAACWSLEECCFGCEYKSYILTWSNCQPEREKKELAGRSGGQGFGEFSEVRWINSFFGGGAQLHSLEIDVCWFKNLPSRSVAVSCTRWRLSASDSSGFCPNRSGPDCVVVNSGGKYDARSSQAHDCRSSYALVKGCEHQLLQCETLRHSQTVQN